MMTSKLVALVLSPPIFKTQNTQHNENSTTDTTAERL